MFNIRKQITALILTVVMLPIAGFATVRAASVASVPGWSIVLVGDCDADVFIDNAVTYKGDGALKLDINSPLLGNVYVDVTQNVPVEAGKKYYVGGMAKGINADTANFIVNWGQRYYPTEYGGTFDWTNYKFLYYAEKTENVTWRFSAEGYGELWIDECFFIDIETGENLLENPTFDTGSASGGTSEVISDENKSNDEIYEKITASESFTEEEINKVIGGFKYIPVYQAKDITIDGKVDDWADYNPIDMPTLSNQYQIYMQDSRLLDVEGSCRFCYDDKYFYMLVEVEDDINYFVPGSGYWTGDSLQMAVSSMEEGYGSELGLTVNPETGEMEIFGMGDSVTPVMAKGSVSGTHTVYEFAFPWDSKFSEAPKKMLFNILINDNDGDGRRYCAELAPGISEGKTNVKFPILEFLDSEKDWYGWIESPSGTGLITNTEYKFNYYLVNESDDEKSIKLTYTDTGENETIVIPPHSGVRREITKLFEAENDYNLGVNFECDGIIADYSLDVRADEPMATAEETSEAIKTLTKQVDELKRLIKKCENKGIKADYEEKHCNILGETIGFLEEDLSVKDLARVNYTARVTTRIYEEDKANLNAYLSGTKKPLEAPVWIGADITSDEYSLISEMEMPDGSIEERPVFFNGYGHGLAKSKIANFDSTWNANTTQFELGPSQAMSTYPAWTFEDSGGGTYSYEMEKDVVKDGEKSFKIVWESEQKPNVYLRIKNTFDTIPGHTYVMKCWVKGDNLQGDATIFPDVWDWGSSQRVNGTFDWKELTFEKTAASDSMQVHFNVEAPCDALYFDGFEVYDKEDPDTNIIRNGSFEEGDGKMPVFDYGSANIKEIIDSLDVCEENNVYADFIISPHYFFDDIIKNNDIAVEGNTFIKYNVNAPIAREIVETHIRSLIPMIKDHPALRSITISNEPMFNTRGCGDYYNEDWWRFLEQRYNGSIEELNASYGTSYSAFNEIDQNADQKTPAKNYDYFLFCSDVFAKWHEWMAGIIKEIAPDIPITSKIFAYVLDKPSNMLRFNVDAEKFAEFTDLNGCDAYNNMDSLYGPLVKEMWYDYMQSISQRPVLDTENHYVADRNESMYFEEVATHIGQDIFNGAVHGRANAISWILARSTDKTNQVRGNIMYRPDALVVSSDTTYDLNRLAYEITSLQKEPKEVAVLYTNSSTLNNDSSLQAIYRAYSAIAFHGKIPRFVVESQLEKMDNYDILIVPQLPFAAPETFEKIADYIKNGGRVIILNENSLSKTDKNLEPDAELRKFIFDNSEVVEFYATTSGTSDEYINNLNKTYRRVLEEEGLYYAELIDAQTGEICENVEYVLGICDGKLILNIANKRDKKGASATVQLKINGEPVNEMLDLRSGETVEGAVTVDAYDYGIYKIEVDSPFIDTYRHWGADEITELYSKGLVKGVSESRFNPNAYITRAEFLALVTRALGISEGNFDGEIPDVKASDWFAGTVAAGLANNLIEDSEFRPNAAITREEMCIILARACEYAGIENNGATVRSFTDEEKIIDTEAVDMVSGLGIVNGYEDGSFRPDGTATRAEASAMLNRFTDLKGEMNNE
ncbi:MAG: S-layer homology domain-containing protein [Clostridia bacterium]|nr:S-layer homology domain-containing protein [Clostridia bacterium]